MEKKLFKSKSDKKLMGVCGGLGKYFDKDSNLIRIIAVVLGLFTGGAALVAYLIAGFVLPEGE
ncbi:PspC domain-containing protein [Pseudoleptotrichia goodfellowii]|uniref:PspC domain protein n=1 Tax=Pseudoleptotrichia goodfellowii F0264 TaxID=596323 RepID=D0GJY9_9FUSO|nr:PspC domain-containing protein [Pseudoleptotrichia goodfellowii]EEY35674.1 PspC domain protein [Pseudoleptotrichia goodfellowii F0264]